MICNRKVDLMKKLPKIKNIAKILIEEHNCKRYFFELQAVKRSYVSCDLPGQEYGL
jgi:hypothetical protein